MSSHEIESLIPDYSRRFKNTGMNASTASRRWREFRERGGELWTRGKVGSITEIKSEAREKVWVIQKASTWR